MGLNLTDIQFEIENNDALADQSVAQTGGGFERKRLPMGMHPIRLASYIELGVQGGGTYDGKQKPDEAQARMDFEFLGKRTVEETTDEAGNTKVFAPRKSVTKKLSLHTKAGFYKMFQQMRAGDSSITHMAQMIATKAWLVNVIWVTLGDDGNRVVITKSTAEKYETRLKGAKTDKERKDFRIFDNIDWSSLRAPMVPVIDEDGEDTGEVRQVPVRDLVGDLKLFLWDNPQPKFWESLFIEGTYTRKVGDKEEEVSKNFIQEKILGAKNFEGSPLQGMLQGLDDLPGMVSADDGDVPSDEAPIEKEQAPDPKSKEDDGEFAELGL